jgi:hypothetical protein
MRWLRIIACVAFVAGLATGIAIFYIAAEHNAQGALISENKIDWSYASLLVLAGFLAGSIVIGSVLLILSWLVRLIRRT